MLALKTGLVALALFAFACREEDRAQTLESQARTQASAKTSMLQSQASAPNCMEDAWRLKPGNASKDLGCTANDVRIASAGNIRGLDGQPLTQCVAGTRFSFIGDFTVQASGNVERFDIGMYFGTDGDPDHTGALNGMCDVSVIESTTSSSFVQLDPSPPDVCGDINGSHNPQVVTRTVSDVECQDSDGDGQLNLPNCTSWRQSGTNEICTGPVDAVPGTTSKCNCDDSFDVPIHVAPPEARVIKQFLDLCSTKRVGVTVINDSPVSSLVVNELIDTVYGELTVVHGDVLSTTCAQGTAIAVGASYQCEFRGYSCSSVETDRIGAVLTDQSGVVIKRGSNSLTVVVTATTTSAP